MNITHVITTIERGGAEKAVLALAAAQARSGHNVRVIPLKGKPELAQNFRDNQVQVLLGLLNQNPRAQVRLLRACTSGSEIVHSHLPRAEVMTRLAFGKGSAIVTRHNSEKFFPMAPSFVSSKLSRWVTRQSHVVAISNAVLDYLRQSGELHHSCRPRVIYYGYEIQYKDEIKPREVKPDKEIKLGTISRLTGQKNLPLLIELIKQQVIKGRSVSLSIVGEGPLKSKLQKLVFDLGVSEHVKFLGKREDVFSFLTSIDFFLLASNYEGFGLAMLEAFDAGVPVIASNVSSIPEVLGHDHPGLFTCNSINSLVEVFEEFVNSKELLTEVVILQGLRLRIFSMDRYLDSHNDLYLNYLRLA